MSNFVRRNSGPAANASALFSGETKEIPGLQLWYQKGCARGIPIKRLLDSVSPPNVLDYRPPALCFDLSAEQLKILRILYAVPEFQRISVSDPGWTAFPPRSYSHEAHTAPGTDMDFVVLNSQGEASSDSVLFRAFQYLASDAAKAQGFVGGVGIGVLNADPHLHVDMRHAQTIRWIEVDHVVGHEIVEGSKDWPTFYQIAKNQYGWKSEDPRVSPDGPGNGWPLLPLALGAAGGAFGLTKDYLHAAAYGAGGLAIGYVVNAILRKVGVDMEK